jgi:hypothetical protein
MILEMRHKMHINFFEYIRYFDNIGACFRVPHRAPDFTGSALLSTHRNSRKKRGYQEKEERALAPTSTADMVGDWERRVVLVVRVRQVRPVAEGVCKK